jgi:hypothetical protein
MATRSKRLAIGTLSSAGSHSVYTCPATAVALVKHVGVEDGSGNVTTVVVSVLEPISGATGPVTAAFSMPAFNVAGGDTWVVLEPGDQLLIYCSDHPMTYLVAGAELSFP